MKILAIRGRNLNSLTGEWAIDLSLPEYTSEGIFAITGPTGAGKSTILDALSLALFGRTPRLERVNAAGNEIISRSGGDCYAEVDFAAGAGRWRVSWSQKKARNSPQGKLQSQRHELHNLITGTVDGSVSSVPDRVAEICGLDYARFCRSILLAQGDFAAFLRSGKDERAAILQQITGTDSYAELSKLCFQTAKACREARANLAAELAAIQTLAPEERATLETEQTGSAARLTELKASLADLETSLRWRQELDRLEADRLKLDRQATALADERQAFAADGQRLADALRAAEADQEFSRWQSLRDEQARDSQTLSNVRQNLPAAETLAAAAAAARDLAAADLEVVAQRNKSSHELLKQVRELDIRLQAASTSRLEAATRLQTLTGQRTQEAAALEGWVAAAQHDQAERSNLAAWLELHRPDAELAASLASLEAALNRQRESLERQTALQVQADALRAEQATGLAERQHLSAARERAESDVQAALAELQRGQTGQASLLGGRRHEDLLREKEDLHRRQLLESRIASLEDERRALRAGQPCPLCGAVDHPWSELTQSDILGATLSAAKLPAELPFEDDLAARLDQVNRLLEAARLAEGRVATQAARLQETRLALAERDSALAVSDNQSGQLAARLASLQTEQNAAATHSTELVAGIERDLMALGDQPGSAEVAAAGGHNATDHKATDYGAAIRRLKARLQAWQAGRQRLEVLEASLQESGKRQALVQASLDRVDGELPVASSALVSAIEDADRLSSQRAALYGNKDVTVGEAELERAAAVAATAATTARQRWQETQDSLLRLRGQAHDLAASLDQRRPDLEAARVALDASLARLGFATEADGSADAGSVADAACLACRLPPLERRRLQERQADLQQRQAGLDSLNADLSRRLAAQSVRQLSPLTAVALAAARDEIAQAQQAATERSTELRLRLEADDGNAALANQKRNSLTGLQAEEARWTSLDDLIGSADGKKYNKFAQHLTLRGLIELSNRKLALFSDRYRLVPNDEANLEFDIIDEWQAGEIRSTRNLSGGESFLVSLALALGLADLSSRHASLDSLFLDEGFGTLDEESLESALGTLAALRTEGKLIGVISHVPAIRERIATHIEVRPLSGGRSRLEGPGVSYKNIT